MYVGTENSRRLPSWVAPGAALKMNGKPPSCPTCKLQRQKLRRALSLPKEP